jgi:acetylornithine deacetylase/succinyl-diaminopimelate desuccinylase-like protein
MSTVLKLPASIRHLREMVAIPSVNPMNREDLPDEIVGEHNLAEHIATTLRSIGLDSSLIGRNGRTSVVAEAHAHRDAETVLIASHLDTVPVDGMEIPPFDPAIENDQLFGRGSCDTKAGMAALLAALAPVLETGRLKRNIIIVGEADEELGSIGVADVLAHLGARRPDWVLATEPTDLRLIQAHKGVVHARLCARGRACHSSEPGRGKNAIVILARAILAIEKSATVLTTRPHPQLGAATLSIGVVQGGQAPNIVPDEARFWVDRRTLPHETIDSVRAELEAALAAAELVGEVFVESCQEEKPPLGPEPCSPAIAATAAALSALNLPAEPTEVAFGTDAGVFARAGIPGIVMGPGSIQMAHTSRESVPIPQVETMVRVFEELLTSGPGKLSGTPRSHQQS